MSNNGTFDASSEKEHDAGKQGRVFFESRVITEKKTFLETNLGFCSLQAKQLILGKI